MYKGNCYKKEFSLYLHRSIFDQRQTYLKPGDANINLEIVKNKSRKGKERQFGITSKMKKQKKKTRITLIEKNRAPKIMQEKSGNGTYIEWAQNRSDILQRHPRISHRQRTPLLQRLHNVITGKEEKVLLILRNELAQVPSLPTGLRRPSPSQPTTTTSFPIRGWLPISTHSWKTQKKKVTSSPPTFLKLLLSHTLTRLLSPPSPHIHT
jgi:hypothetical protein